MSDNEPSGWQKSALIINSDERITHIVSHQLSLFGWQTEEATTIPQALELLNAKQWYLIFFSHTLRAQPALPVERQLERLQPDAHLFRLQGERSEDPTDSPVRDIFCELELSAGDEQAGVRLLRRWLPVVEERITELQDAVELPIDTCSDSPIIGACPAMQETRRHLARLSGTREPCLITGAEGTGKLLVARTLHEMRHQEGEAMTLIMCEEENEKLSTGEHSLLSGVMKTDWRGTIYLTQLEMASDKLQSALLDLDYSTGASTSIIASSCRNLHEMVECGAFSAELYSRLMNYIHLPPLKDRREDIGLLLAHFVGRFINKPHMRVSQLAWKLLQEHAWEFNLPELHSVALNAVASGAGAICVMDIPFANEKQ